MDYKVTKLEEMNTWTEIDESDLPPGAQSLLGMWVHLIKNLETREHKFRSHWVVQGDKQKTDLSLSDTFALVSRITSLWILPALVTIRSMRIFAWDIDSAYLHGKIQHNIFMEFPNGYKIPGKVGKLNKGLYGLPEAAQVWHKDLKDKLKSLRFIRLGSDTGVFLKTSKRGFTVIDTYINDSMGICSSEEESRLKAGIQSSTK